MRYLKLAVGILCVPLGIALFIFGGYDDSPGAQLLGALVVFAGGITIYRSRSTKGN